MPGYNKQTLSVYHILSFSSLCCGLLGLISIFYPPAGLLLGVSAILTAWLSRNRKPCTGLAFAGTILGGIAALLSILIFAQYVFVMDYMTNPDNASVVREILKKYQDILRVTPVS